MFVDGSYCKKVSTTENLSMWFVNLVTVPSCDGMILKKTGNINMGSTDESVGTEISFLFLAICEQVMVEMTFVSVPDMNNVLTQGSS